MSDVSWAVIDSKQNKYDNDKPIKIQDLVGFYDKSNFTRQYKRIRFFGPVVGRTTHIVKCSTANKQDPSKMRSYMYSVDCINYNPETGEFEDNGCPYCNCGIPKQTRFYQNAIIRELEENAPELGKRGERTPYEQEVRLLGDKKFYLKENVNTSAWTPVRIVEIPRSLISSLKEAEELNFYKDPETGERKQASIADLKYGIDIYIKFDDTAKEMSKYYTAQRVPDIGKTPITNEMRKEYLVWKLVFPKLDKDKVIKDFNRSVERITNANDKETWQKIVDSLKPASTTTKEAKPIATVTLDDEDMMDTNEITPAQQAMEDVSFEAKAPVNLDDEFEDL